MHPASRANPQRLRPATVVAGVVALLLVLVGLASSPARALGATTSTTVATLPAAATAVTTPTAASFDVGRPAWWDGDCDANRFNRIARSYGWTGEGSHRMGASYLGVPVCGPRPWVDGSPNVLWGRAGWGEAEWQCVELAQRFMAQVYGTRAYQANGGQVVSNYSTAYGGGLVKVSNGTSGVAPQPGDIVSFRSPSNPWGHAGVVADVTVDANGNGTVKMLSQNDTRDGWRTLTLASWWLTGLGSLQVYGWLHDPLGRGNPLGDGAFVKPSDSKYAYRIVGGAPVRVTSWKAYGGFQPYTVVPRGQFDALRDVPRDGTYIKDSSTGQVYRIIGGAPLLVGKADAAKMPYWATAPKMVVDHVSLMRRDHMTEVPADGTQMCRADTGACYVAAGGAPMLVPPAAMATLPGWTQRTKLTVSGAEFASWSGLRQRPAEGTFLCDAADGSCYVVAGGAALLMGASDPRVPGFSRANAVTIAHWELARTSRLRAYPADGTVLCPAGDKQCYVVAGRAAIAIAPSSKPAVDLADAVRVSRTELRTPRRLSARPVDGTLLKSAQTGAVYIVKNGVAVPHKAAGNAASTTVPVTIDQAAIDNAGMPGAWNHLASSPAVARLSNPAVTVQTASSAVLSWPVPVASSLVTSYDIRYQRGSATQAPGPWTTPAAWVGVTGTTVQAGLAPGTQTCFSVRAHNRAGQVGPWSPSSCISTPLDDRAATRTTPGWVRTQSPLFYAGTATRTTTAGARWILEGVTSSHLAVVATTCPTCGKVAVWFAGSRVGVLDLAAPTTSYGTVLDLPAFPQRTGAVTLISTTTGKIVQIDGLISVR